MTRTTGDSPLRPLAHAMLTALPKFGIWAQTMREFQTPYGTIGYRQASILWVIRYRLLPPDEMTPTSFASFHRIQPSVVTRALAKLEQGGFICRTVDPADTRVSRIDITETGTLISQYIEEIYMAELLAVLDPLTAEQHHALACAMPVLDAIADDLDRRRLGRTRRAGSSSATDESHRFPR